MEQYSEMSNSKKLVLLPLGKGSNNAKERKQVCSPYS